MKPRCVTFMWGIKTTGKFSKDLRLNITLLKPFPSIHWEMSEINLIIVFKLNYIKCTAHFTALLKQFELSILHSLLLQCSKYVKCKNQQDVHF